MVVVLVLVVVVVAAALLVGIVIVSVGVETILSQRAASLGEAKAFNCFPRFRIVS